MDKLIVLSAAFHTFFVESDDEDEEEGFQTTRENNENYVEEVVPRFSNKSFKQHFRMNPDVFESVCKDLHSQLAREHHRPGRNPLFIDKQLMITLWYLGNSDPLRSIADRFGVCISTCWRVVLSVCDALIKLNAKKKIIKWPTPEEAAKTSRHYYSKYKCQGIVGCLDGSHVLIRAPVDSPKSYINGKGFHSVLLQGVCNEKMEFLYCYTGECGSIHDAELMERSGLESRINSGQFGITAEQHLLGDSAYPLKQWLLTPFQDNGHLRDEQIIFNTVLSKCRVVIKRAFGLLKGRFRRLLHIDCLRPAAIVRFIIAACILHNICLQNHDISDEFLVNETENEDENESKTEHNETQSATSKRTRLLNSLF